MRWCFQIIKSLSLVLFIGPLFYDNSTVLSISKARAPRCLLHLDRHAPRTRNAAARQNPHPQGRGGRLHFLRVHHLLTSGNRAWHPRPFTRGTRTHLKNVDHRVQGKARGGEKAQHTRQYVSILSRPATPPWGLRRIFEMGST
jgi:hypothetical protein